MKTHHGLKPYGIFNTRVRNSYALVLFDIYFLLILILDIWLMKLMEDDLVWINECSNDLEKLKNEILHYL